MNFIAPPSSLDLEVPEVGLVQPDRLDVVRQLRHERLEQAILVGDDERHRHAVSLGEGLEERSGLVQVGDRAEYASATSQPWEM